jgi:SagB-type dehydrogenase family enzyme
MGSIEPAAIALPEPRSKGTLPLEQAIGCRRSRRGYKSEPITLVEVSQLLWAAQGTTGPEDQRTAPSAGALYPLELYFSATRVEGLAPGIYKYRPETHDLVAVVEGDKRRELTAATQWQDCMRFSAAVLLFAAVYARTTVKYGERGIRYVHMETGSAVENVYLEATALGLGTVCVGSFDDAELAAVAHLPEGEDPICMMPIGRI